MSNNPHQSRTPQEQPLHWQSPVALQTAPGDPETELAELHAGDHETSGLHATQQGGEGPGLASELVLTAIVVLGVVMATCSALYFAGAFTSLQRAAPGAHEVASPQGVH